MIWACWRGGNPLGTPRAVRLSQEGRESGLLVAAAEAPHGGGVALPARGDILHRFTAGDRQDDPGPLDLEVGEGDLSCDVLQAGKITAGQRNGARFATAHGSASREEWEGQEYFSSSIATAPNSLHYFWPEPLVVTAQPPATITAGSGFGLVVVAVDPFGNVDTSFNDGVTVGLTNQASGGLGGTVTATASNGV